MIDKEDFIEYVAEKLYEESCEDRKVYQPSSLIEIEEYGWGYPLDDNRVIEDLDSTEYKEIYEKFLDENTDLVDEVNGKFKEIFNDNYDCRADDERAYMKLVFGR